MRPSRILYTSLCAATILAGTSATTVLADEPTSTTTTAATTNAAPAPTTTAAATTPAPLPNPPKDKSSANGWIQFEESGAVKAIGSVDSDVVGLIAAVFALFASMSSVILALVKTNPFVTQFFRDVIKRVK
ncbi:hypothetical protein [Corynebacterium sp. HS2168-gen11]|uniref:hypothetical protein n=1 Tax=Corynebacterium sp. HS2168-gen11 TaxID=2974027 RepID=UPI00216ACA30|nr:hypothetical protein [Corynebacterium sp. HS2168-gen11]MCS4536222.1 hypothetical protein [Corynebacterium sp. HS2168-gen11]